jgi:hypothetical protein
MTTRASEQRAPWRVVYSGRTLSGMAFVDELCRLPGGRVELLPRTSPVRSMSPVCSTGSTGPPRCMHVDRHCWSTRWRLPRRRCGWAGCIWRSSRAGHSPPSWATSARPGRERPPTVCEGSRARRRHCRRDLSQHLTSERATRRHRSSPCRTAWRNLLDSGHEEHHAQADERPDPDHGGVGRRSHRRCRPHQHRRAKTGTRDIPPTVERGSRTDEGPGRPLPRRSDVHAEVAGINCRPVRGPLPPRTTTTDSNRRSTSTTATRSASDPLALHPWYKWRNDVDVCAGRSGSLSQYYDI